MGQFPKPPDLTDKHDGKITFPQTTLKDPTVITVLLVVTFVLNVKKKQSSGTNVRFCRNRDLGKHAIFQQNLCWTFGSSERSPNPAAGVRHIVACEGVAAALPVPSSINQMLKAG